MRETVPALVKLKEMYIHSIQNAFKEKSLPLRLYSLPADGDGKDCHATAILTFVNELMTDSKLRKQLGELLLFDYHCGPNAITGDIDFRHWLKRWCNLPLRGKCMTVDGVVITLELIK